MRKGAAAQIHAQTVARNSRTPRFAAPPVFISTFCLALATGSHLFFFFFLPALFSETLSTRTFHKQGFFFFCVCRSAFLPHTDTFLGRYNRRLWKLATGVRTFFSGLTGKAFFFSLLFDDDDDNNSACAASCLFTRPTADG